MSRKLVGATTLVSVVLALMLILAVLINGFQKQYQAEQEIAEFRSRITSMDEDALTRHQTLAKWYNYCLGAKHPEEDWQAAYHTIWNIGSGMMGYLELPDQNTRIPIYHNASVPDEIWGAGHVPGSALPVGGIGNHTVLMVPGEAAVLTEGAVFCVHIPGNVLYYTVRDVITLPPGRTDGLLGAKGEELCTLSAAVQKGKQMQKIRIQGIRCENPSEPGEMPAVEEVLRSAIFAVLCVLTLPVCTGAAGWVGRWVYRRICCWRLTKKLR